MKKLLFKILLFILLFFSICRLISVITPYHWGNPWFSTKIQYLNNINSDSLPNTLFFGSSRMYRQVNPLVFDSLLSHLSSEEINSFNLGAPATFCPQNYYLLNHFLDSKLSIKTKYVFIELMDVNIISKDLLHQERTSYWLTLSELTFCFKSIFSNPSISLRKKISSCSDYCLSYLETIFHLGHYGQQMLDVNYYEQYYLGKDSNGFFPLQEDTLITQKLEVKQQLIKQNKALLSDTTKLIMRAKETNSLLMRNSDYIDTIHLNRIKNIIHLSEKRNISIFFVLPPRSLNRNLSMLYKHIPEKNKIQLVSPQEYPELYNVENSFDIGHLNTTGSHIFSQLLANKANKLIKEN